MGKYSCSCQTTNEDSESILLVATLQSPFEPQIKHSNNVTSKSVEKRNRLLSEPYPRAINYVRKYTRLSSSKAHESLGMRLPLSIMM